MIKASIARALLLLATVTAVLILANELIAYLERRTAWTIEEITGQQ